jgi:PhnB protein
MSFSEGENRTVRTKISPMLAVSDGAAAIEFYKEAFGAVENWWIDAGGHVVAGLSVGEADLFLASASPPHGTQSPDTVGHTTVRIELFVDDPAAAHARAVAAGATEHSRVTEHNHTMSGPHPMNRMLQGSVVDPFGHLWLIGRTL